MKKRLLLGLLAAPLILASCGGNTTEKESKEPTTSQGEAQTTPDAGNSQGEQPGGESTPAAPTESSAAPELTRAEKVEALFAKMATGASSSFVDPAMATTEYYGDTKGFLNFYTDQYLAAGAYDGGMVVIPNFGIYRVSYDTDTDEVDGAQIYSPNKNLKISDLQVTTKDLGIAADTVTFAESARTHTFSTTDSDFVEILASLDGYASVVENYPTKKASFKVSEDGDYLYDVSFDLKGAADSANYPDISETGLKIEKVGTTINLDLEVFITSYTPAAATAWSAQETAIFNSIYQGFSLPFPSGSTYATIETQPQRNQFAHYDLGCGDKRVTYGAQLTAAGFEHSDEDDALYIKTLVEATETRGAILEVVYVDFEATAGTPYATIYPNGIFSITAGVASKGSAAGAGAITDDELNQILAAEPSFDDPTLPVFPTLSLPNNAGIEFQEATDAMQAQYPDTIELFYGVAKIYYATLTDAMAAVQSLIAQFVAYGYDDYTALAQSAGYPDDGYLIYDDGYDFDYTTYDYFEYSVIIRIQIGVDETGGYAGYILVSFDHYGESAY